MIYSNNITNIRCHILPLTKNNGLFIKSLYISLDLQGRGWVGRFQYVIVLVILYQVFGMYYCLAGISRIYVRCTQRS